MTRALARAAAAASLALGFAACRAPGPLPTTYVLGTPSPGVERVEPLLNRPVIEVKQVLVPDYLDTSDLQIRKGPNAVAPSPTGRWGERLSVGITRALAASLTRRLPGYAIAVRSQVERPQRQVLVDVEDFEAPPDGAVVLVARWRVLDGTGRDTLAGERVSLTAPIAGSGDAAIVAAMTAAVEDLAARVAAGIGQVTPAPREH